MTPCKEKCRKDKEYSVKAGTGISHVICMYLQFTLKNSKSSNFNKRDLLYLAHELKLD